MGSMLWSFKIATAATIMGQQAERTFYTHPARQLLLTLRLHNELRCCHRCPRPQASLLPPAELSQRPGDLAETPRVKRYVICHCSLVTS
jgi:hypothetical protein